MKTLTDNVSVNTPCLSSRPKQNLKHRSGPNPQAGLVKDKCAAHRIPPFMKSLNVLLDSSRYLSDNIIVS